MIEFIKITYCYLIILIATINYLQAQQHETLPPMIPVGTLRQCQPVGHESCEVPGYETLADFNNKLGHRSRQEAVAELVKYYYLFKTPLCSEFIKPFLCSLYLPVCPKAPSQASVPEILLPCRHECEYARKECEPFLVKAGQTWPSDWTCHIFPEFPIDLCFTKHNTTPFDQTFDQVVDEPIPQDTAMCDSDNMFDCKIKQNSSRKYLCIEKHLVCDGRADCPDELDEIGCNLMQPNSCQDGQLFCDNDMTSLTLFTLCILVLFCLSIYLLLGFFEEPSQSKQQQQQQQPNPTTLVHEEPNVDSAQQIFNNCNIYAPADVGSVYERINTGGYSGISSIYGSYAYYPPYSVDNNYEDDLREPRAPPPTPAQQSIYLNVDD